MSGQRDPGDDLLGVIRALIELFQDMMKTLGEERDALVQLDVEEIKRLTRVKEEHLLRQKVLEVGRRKALSRMELEPELRLSEVVGVLAQGGEELSRQARRLQEIVRTVREMQEINRSLVAHSLLCIHGSLAVITGDGSAGTYTTQGVEEGGPPRASFSIDA